MKKIILSEIKLYIDEGQYEVRSLSYGSRLINYLSNVPKRHALQRLLTEEVEIVVCCRATAILLANMDCKNIKMIQLTSTGYDGVPVGTFRQKGIAVCNVAGVYGVSIAETVVYAILSVCKKIRKNPKNHRPKLLRKYSEITELEKKKVLIMGTGNIGTEIANRLKAFDCEVYGYDLYWKDKQPYMTIFNARDKLLESLKDYDYVVSTMPGTEETLKFCGEEFFTKMSSKAWFMNVGRDATVDSKALYSALKQKQIGGAIFDTVELIPCRLFNRFRRLSNTFVLPGIATASKESCDRVRNRIQENIKSYIQGNQQDRI